MLPVFTIAAAGHVVALWVGGGVLTLVAVLLLAAARSSDRKTYIIRKATPMPLRLVNERDDVWLHGEAACDSPVVAPHFGFSCLHYRYRLEERVEHTRRDAKGRKKKHHSWKTREECGETAAFRLRQDGLAIEIDAERATFQDLSSTSDRHGDWRHSVTYLEYPVAISAVGSVAAQKKRLEPYQNIPLLITPKTRDDYLRSAESKEKVMRGFGLVLLLVGAAAAFYGLWDHTAWPVDTQHRFQWATLVAAVLPALAIFTPFWSLHVYNSFITYGVRADNAWRQVDVDLKMRYDLIPRLVDVTTAYLKHEKDLLERIAALRTEAVAGDAAKKIGVEGEVVRGLQRLAAVVEDYPDLGSQPMTAKIMRELTALEEKIAHGRAVYNEAATEYNDTIQSFPHVLVAASFGFAARPLFEAFERDRRVPS